MLNISHCQINYEELNKLASQNNCIGTESEVWTVETLNEQIQTKIECGTKIVDAERAFEDQWHTKIELGMASLSVCGEDFPKVNTLKQLSTDFLPGKCGINILFICIIYRNYRNLITILKKFHKIYIKNQNILKVQI